MKLFHGTNFDFQGIDLNCCLPYKDFGRGFYLTDIRRQAQDMAVRKAKIEGIPVLQEYQFDENALEKGNLTVLRFNETSAEWAEFILKNRLKKRKFHHDYDIVIGPIADDGVVMQLNLYEDGMITIEQLIAGLKYRKLNRQYCFCTEKAVSLLTRTK